MSDPNAATEIVFPWLPGELHRLPDPPWTYRDDPEPPKHLILTLAKLAEGCTPQDATPADWLTAIDEDELNSPIRAFAREHFGLLDVWNDKRQSYDWFEAGAKNPDGTAIVVSHGAALQRCWSGHAQLILDDLARQGETVTEALGRIPREWRRWTEARALEFVAKWRDAAAWPPALALSWIMFAGDWKRVAAYLENGRDMPTTGIFLNCIGSWLDEAEEAANKQAARDLMQALRLRADHPKRVIVRGRLNGKGAPLEINPADLASLDWATDPNSSYGAVLERYQGEFYSDVMVDAASLIGSFSVPSSHKEEFDAHEEDVRRDVRKSLSELKDFWTEPYWNVALAVIWVATRSRDEMVAFYCSTNNTSLTLAQMRLVEPIGQPSRLVEPRAVEALEAAFRRNSTVEGRRNNPGVPLGKFEAIPPGEWRDLTGKSGLEIATDSGDAAASALDRGDGRFDWRYRELRVLRSDLMEFFRPLASDASDEPQIGAEANLGKTRASGEIEVAPKKRGRRNIRSAAADKIRELGLPKSKLKELGPQAIHKKLPSDFKVSYPTVCRAHADVLADAEVPE